MLQEHVLIMPIFATREQLNLEYLTAHDDYRNLIQSNHVPLSETTLLCSSLRSRIIENKAPFVILHSQKSLLILLESSTHKWTPYAFFTKCCTEIERLPLCHNL